MSENFQEQHAASLARIAAGAGVLAARVTVNDEMLTVRADQIGQAMLTLHGTPMRDMKVAAQVEYVTMSAADFAALPDWH